MKILLVSATKLEVKTVLKKLKKVKGKGLIFSGRYGRHSVDLLVTGVGMTATAFNLGKYLGRKYDLAINAGVAGSFSRKIALGSVVNVVSDCFADLGAEDGAKFLTLKEMGLPNVTRQKADGRWKSKRVLSDLPQANGITVNTVHGNKASIKKVVKNFNPDVESMEGAAFLFACREFGVPCIQVRAISNYVERRNRKNWQLGIAVENLNVFLDQLLCTL